jgi:hypothetical protein
MDFESKQKIGIVIQKHVLSTKIGYVIDKMISTKRKCEPIEDTSYDTSKVVYVDNMEIDKMVRRSEPELSAKEITASRIRDIYPPFNGIK